MVIKYFNLLKTLFDDILVKIIKGFNFTSSFLIIKVEFLLISLFKETILCFTKSHTEFIFLTKLPEIFLFSSYLKASNSILFLKVIG